MVKIYGPLPIRKTEKTYDGLYPYRKKQMIIATKGVSPLGKVSKVFKQILVEKCDISRQKMKNIESPKMNSKVLWELLIKSYEQFSNSEICSKFSANYPYEKRKKFKTNYLCGKKQWFQKQKHEKYLKSKNDVKKLLGAFNQELWAI